MNAAYLSESFLSIHLVRPSGTESLIRVMLEGEDSDRINRAADELCGLVIDFDGR